MNNDYCLLSVVVTVYNKQKYIEKCLKSILNQTYRDFELIIVDDKSTDDSLRIIKQITIGEKNVKIIENPQNIGLPSSRLRGVEESKGYYITFVDGDDWLEQDTYESAVEIIKKHRVDVITFGYTYEIKESGIVVLDLYEDGLYGKEDIGKKIFPTMIWNETHGRRGVSSAVWNKLIKRELLLSHLRSVDKTINLGEDALITYPIMAEAKSIYILNITGYHYVYHEDGMIHTQKAESIKEWVRFGDALNSLMANESDIFKLQVDNYVLSNINDLINIIYRPEIEFRKRLEEEAKIYNFRLCEEIEKHRELCQLLGLFHGSDVKNVARKLKSFFETHKQVYFYGAGFFGKQALILTIDVNRSPKGFIVTTKRTGEETAFGFPLISINEFEEIKKEGVGIIISVGKEKEPEIIEKLMKIPFSDYICIMDLYE